MAKSKKKSNNNHTNSSSNNNKGAGSNSSTKAVTKAQPQTVEVSSQPATNGSVTAGPLPPASHSSSVSNTSNNHNKSNNNNNNNSTGNSSPPLARERVENLDTLDWLRYCYGEQPTTTHSAGPPGTATTTATSSSPSTSSSSSSNSASANSMLLEYQPDDRLLNLLQQFLEHSMATKQVVELVYQIWQQTVLSTLLASAKVWRQTHAVITTQDQRALKQRFKWARYKIHFLLHHVVGGMLSSPLTKWHDRRLDVLQIMCWQSLALLPRLAESVPHHKTNVRQVLIHFDGKEFLAAVACETWDTLYDYGIPEALDPPQWFIPVLRRCAMLDILDKDWNMLGGWEDVLRGLEAKCGGAEGSNPNALNTSSSPQSSNNTTIPTIVPRLPCDAILHAQTTILRNARNSMQCKFFSVRFLRYTDDQAPQRWRYFPKCSAPACSNLETPQRPHPFRCRNCWYFHYCSPACRDYCDDLMGLHGKFCQDTPPAKAAQCQLETEHYLLSSLLASTTTPSCIPVTDQSSNARPQEDGNNNNNTDGDEPSTPATPIVCNACGAAEDWILPTSLPSLSSSSSSQNSTTSNNNSSNNGNGSTTMKRCSQCQAVYYCSRLCQEWDWRNGGHKQVCFPKGGGVNNNKAQPATTNTNDPKKQHGPSEIVV